MKKATKQIYKKYVIVLICLLMVGSSPQGVLCFGADGHIEIESAFHGRCEGHEHSQPVRPKQLSCHPGQGAKGHCEPCVDVPVAIGMTKIGRAYKQLNSSFSTPAVNAVVPAGRPNLSAYSSALSIFDAVSYFTPLRTVIFLL
jgi:hypothetical protein